MIVADTSVFTDFLIIFDEDRHRKARLFLTEASRRGIVFYEPFLFDVELAGVLCRRYSREVVYKILREVRNRVELLDEALIHEAALDVAVKTHCRAIDAYFIATTKETGSTLISNDKLMVSNARKYGIEAYYLIEESKKAMELLKKL